jgi:hypothetical protein
MGRLSPSSMAGKAKLVVQAALLLGQLRLLG